MKLGRICAAVLAPSVSSSSSEHSTAAHCCHCERSFSLFESIILQAPTTGCSYFVFLPSFWVKWRNHPHPASWNDLCSMSGSCVLLLVFKGALTALREAGFVPRRMLSAEEAVFSVVLLGSNTSSFFLLSSPPSPPSKRRWRWHLGCLSTFFFPQMVKRGGGLAPWMLKHPPPPDQGCFCTDL